MNVQIILAEVLDGLAQIPDDSVHCVFTSPPYWGLRDYGVEGQLGLEPSLGEHLDVMVQVFAEVRRVLRKDGTCWINYGDCYATTPNGRSNAATKTAGGDDRTFRDKPFSTVGRIGSDGSGAILKPKDLCMVANRLAIALHEDGWYVRDEIIWHKTNPMPSSVKDRCTPSHEKLWLLSKSPKYHFDATAVREPSVVADWDNGTRVYGGKNKHGANLKQQRTTGRVAEKRPAGWAVDGPHTAIAHNQGERKPMKTTRGTPPGTERHQTGIDQVGRGEGRHPRNVWSIATKPYPDAHFATFPPELVRRGILAGCPPGGTVLDPFAGTGTTGAVAMELGRKAILIEINPEYGELIEKRLGRTQPGFDFSSPKQIREAAE